MLCHQLQRFGQDVVQPSSPVSIDLTVANNAGVDNKIGRITLRATDAQIFGGAHHDGAVIGTWDRKHTPMQAHLDTVANVVLPVVAGRAFAPGRTGLQRHRLRWSPASDTSRNRRLVGHSISSLRSWESQARERAPGNGECSRCRRLSCCNSHSIARAA